MSSAQPLNPAQSLPAPSCLFTGVALGPNTREEHTIPRSLGGRIRSHIVSSDTFNNDCGGRVDPYLIRLYAETVCHLGPLMSAEHQPGNLGVEIPGSPGRFVLDSEGSLTVQGIAVVGRDVATGRPNAIAGADPAAVRRWVDRNAPAGSTLRESFVPATTQPNFFLNRLVIAPVIEIAAMKSAMLSFDHLLAGDPARRFTRAPALEPVRRFVREAVATMEYDGADLHRFSLGIQYERLADLQRFRERIGGAHQPFEHVLFASGNNATRTLDCVFWVMGIDPFGFRLCNDWRGGDFFCTVVNGVLVNGTVTGPVWTNLPESICQPTDRRSYPGHGNEAVMQSVMGEMAVHRADGFRRAVDLVERTDRDILTRRLTTTAQLARNGDNTVGGACRARLARLYQDRINTPNGRSEFDSAVSGALAAADPAVLATGVTRAPPVPQVEWARVLPAYYDALDRLSAHFGLPGEVFVSATVIGTNASGEGRLDDHPLSIQGNVPSGVSLSGPGKSASRQTCQAAENSRAAASSWTSTMI